MSTSGLLCLAMLRLGMPNAEEACQFTDLVVASAEDSKVRPELIVAVIHYESRWTPTAKSRAGACGLMQVLPKFTGNKKTGVKKMTCKQLKNPDNAIVEGSKLLGYWINKFARGGEHRGVCAYLAGYGCKKGKMNRKGVKYSRKVRRLANKILRTMRRIEAEDPVGC